jgi:hypothetical protein
MLHAQQWSFVAIADHRDNFTTYTNALRKIKAIDPEFVVAAGDLDPLKKNYEEYYREILDADDPAFFPVRGNHDTPDDVVYMRKKVLALQPNVVYRDSTDSLNCTYYVDWKNVRLIVLDQYHPDLGKRNGCVNIAGIRWSEHAIASADSADHIFIAFHEPAFPRFKHVGESFDKCREYRNEFWNVLIAHRDKVRAVFAGHSLHYYAMRVNNPLSGDGEGFPDEEGGVYQFDLGGAGMGEDGKNTIMNVVVTPGAVRFDVYQADNGADTPFSLTDSRQMDMPQR